LGYGQRSFPAWNDGWSSTVDASSIISGMAVSLSPELLLLGPLLLAMLLINIGHIQQMNYEPSAGAKNCQGSFLFIVPVPLGSLSTPSLDPESLGLTYSTCQAIDQLNTRK
jgi:hypothetical protein